MLRIHFSLLILTLFFCIGTNAQPLGYTYVKNLTIQGSKIPGGYAYVKTLTIQGSKLSGTEELKDFTVLVSFTDPDLRTIANGGHLSNVNGYDIFFSMSNNCGVALPFQIERYNAATGELIAWVKVPSLTPGVNTSIDLLYGNAYITADPSSNAVWAVGTQARYHLNQNPSISPQIDCSPNGVNSTGYIGTMTAGSVVNGKIGNGLNLNGSQAIQLPNSIFLSGNYTLSAWYYYTTNNNYGCLFGGNSGYALSSQRSPSLYLLNASFYFGRSVVSPAGWCNGTATGVASDTWQLVTYVYDGSNLLLYINGVLQQNTANACNSQPSYALQALNRIGCSETNVYFYNGQIDEMAISSVARTPDWILSEYNNQNDPASFITVSAEGSAIPCAGNTTTNLNDFTVMVHLTDPDLRSVANGGHVANDNGYDLMFTEGNNCGASLPFQMERYDATIGEVIAWVKVASLTPGMNTSISLFYGNPNVIKDPSSNTVWAEGTQARYHMNQDPGASPQMDCSSNGVNSTGYIGTMTASSVVNAKIGNGLSLNGSQAIQLPNSIFLTGNYTLSAWYYYTTNNNYGSLFGGNSAAYTSQQRSPSLYLNGSSFHYGRAVTSPAAWCSNGSSLASGAASGTWQHVAYVYDGSSQRLYVNGALQQNLTNSCNSQPGYPSQALNRLGCSETNLYFFNGQIDEVSISSVARTPSWIATEYNNQNDPASFIAVSAEQPAINLCQLLPVTLTAFTATAAYDQKSVNLSWSTAMERENAYFMLYKSTDVHHWTEVSTHKGLGNTTTGHRYTAVDPDPARGINYYRLKQVDKDGTFTWFDVLDVTIAPPEAIRVFPVPAKDVLMVQFSDIHQSGSELSLINAMGIRVYDQVLSPGSEQAQLDIRQLENGVYLLEISFAKGKEPLYRKVLIQHE